MGDDNARESVEKVAFAVAHKFNPSTRNVEYFLGCVSVLLYSGGLGE